MTLGFKGKEGGVLHNALSSHQLKSAFIIAILFALSVGIRMPYMNRPLGVHQQYLMAHALRTPQIWCEGGGASNDNFLPIMSYDNPADKNINNQGRIKDSKGNYYYVSYGPLAHVVPYLVFKVFRVYPSIKAFQIFGLSLHFICCLLVYLIAVLLTRKDCRGRMNIAALMGFTVYLFSPVTLWYHANTYMSEIFVQLPFIAGIYIFLRLMAAPRKSVYYLLLGLSIFLMILTEWIGLIFALVLAVYCLLNFHKKSMRIVLGVVCLSSLSALALILWHYSKIAGLQALIQVLSEKFVERMGVSEGASLKLYFWEAKTWRIIAEHYAVSYGWFLLYIYFVKFFLKDTQKGGAERAVLFLCFWPVFIHHFIFSNFTSVHDFSVLKAGFLMAFLLALVYSKIDHYLFLKWGSGSSRILRTRGLIVGFCLVTLLSIHSYFETNQEFVDRYETMGKEIARVADKKEVVFLNPEVKNEEILPQVVFYAHRNIVRWVNDESALSFLKNYGAPKGIIMIFDHQPRLIRVQHISIDQGKV